MSLHPITKAIRTQTPTTDEMEHSTPLFLTSSFRFDSAEDMADAFNEVNDHNIYTRFSNPTVQEFTDKMCALEGAEAGFSCASGMSAIFGTFMTFLQSGDHVLSCASVFGSTHTLFTKYMPKWGITYSYGSVNDVKSWEALIQPNTKMIYLETPTNPGLDIIDLEEVAKLAKKHNLLFIVDNCFATPILQRPIEFGADLVIHSATKWIDGQGRVLGGIVVGKKELIREIYLFCRNTGPSMSPFNAWVLTKSLETLDIRIQRHCDNAEALAKKLAGHPKISMLKYPFLPTHASYEVAKKQMNRGGGLLNFEVRGGLDGGRKFMNSLKLITLTSNLGDSRTIASHPASTTHSKLSPEDQLAVGITPGMIRLSVGLEYVDDIAADILQALDQC